MLIFSGPLGWQAPLGASGFAQVWLVLQGTLSFPHKQLLRVPSAQMSVTADKFSK